MVRDADGSASLTGGGGIGYCKIGQASGSRVKAGMGRNRRVSIRFALQINRSDILMIGRTE